jgi:hypothetical protein
MLFQHELVGRGMSREMNNVKSITFFGHGAPDTLDRGRVGGGHFNVSGFPKVLKLIENGAAILVCVELEIWLCQRRVRGYDQNPQGQREVSIRKSCEMAC